MTPPALNTELTPLEFGLFRDWIHRHSGIFLEDSKAESLRLSLHTRAASRGFDDYRGYFRMLSENEDEFRELMNLVTINETSFYRFPAQFQALREHVVPDLLARAEDSARVRVWSAGCSTGEEPYSIATALLGSPLALRQVSLEVLGTDVSTDALERARLGRYTERSLGSLPADVASRWFEPVGKQWQPIEAVRQVCRFEYHNLMRDPHPPGAANGWDVIFCRNVTIYFQPETTRRVIQNLFEALKPGGYLFLGHSETLASVSDRFEVVEAAGVFFYRKPGLGSAGAALHSRRRTRPVTVERPARVVSAAMSARHDAEPARGAIAAGPSSSRVEADATLRAAFGHADLGDLETAERETKAVLAAEPLSAAAHYLLGVIQREQGQSQRAVAAFRRTLCIDKDFALAHFALAGMHHRAGESTEASREYEITLGLLDRSEEGAWASFLDGFTPELLAQSCRRGLLECRGVGSAAKGASHTRR
jgi:chemotaxis protein methyltransferase CheR